MTEDFETTPATALAAPPRPGERVLVSRLRYLGDVVLSLPLVAALRRLLPACELHYLAEPAGLALLEAQPDVDRLWAAPRSAWGTVRLAHALRQQHFAAAIDLFCNPRSAFLVRTTGARLRIGEARRVRRHAYTLARVLLPGRSALEQHLDAVRGLGLAVPPATRPVLHLGAAEREAGSALWRRHASEPGVVLHLGATQPAKEWPVEHAVALVRALARDGVPVLLTTAPNRPEPSAAVAAAASGAARLLPVLPLRATLGVLAGAAAVVSVDGALAHAAVALGRPTLALFGPTDPAVWFPYAAFGPYRVLHAGDMAALEPEAVLAALRGLAGRAAVVPEAGGA